MQQPVDVDLPNINFPRPSVFSVSELLAVIIVISPDVRADRQNERQWPRDFVGTYVSHIIKSVKNFKAAKVVRTTAMSTNEG